MNEEDEKQSDLRILQDVCKVLREQFDTVQVFVTRVHDDNGGTRSADWGSGNWYARYGQVSGWVKCQDAYEAKIQPTQENE